MANTIFVLSYGRTGSTLLCELLTHYQHTKNLKEALGFDGELTLKEQEFWMHLCNKYNKITLTPRELISTAQEYFAGTTVLKIHLQYLDLWPAKELAWILSQPNHQFILLERANFLEMEVSRMLAEQLNMWHVVDTSDIKIKIDPLLLIESRKRYLNRYFSIKNKLDKLSIDYQYIEYGRDLKSLNVDSFINLIDPWIKRSGLNLELGELPELSVLRQNNNNNIFTNILNREEIEELIKNNYEQK